MTHATWTIPTSEAECVDALYALEDPTDLPKTELQRRLQSILDVTDSHVACWRVAQVWAEWGEGKDFTRRALVQSEDYAGGWVDYSGEFDDFEEEDSWRGILAQIIAANLDDEPWVARLGQEGLAEDEYVDRLYDDVRALCMVSEPVALQALHHGARDRLDRADVFDAAEALDQLLQSIEHLMPTSSAHQAILLAALEVAEAAFGDLNLDTQADALRALFDAIGAAIARRKVGAAGVYDELEGRLVAARAEFAVAMEAVANGGDRACRVTSKPSSPS